jgi:hypothetical protein
VNDDFRLTALRGASYDASRVVVPAPNDTARRIFPMNQINLDIATAGVPAIRVD